VQKGTAPEKGKENAKVILSNSEGNVVEAGAVHQRWRYYTES